MEPEYPRTPLKPYKFNSPLPAPPQKKESCRQKWSLRGKAKKEEAPPSGQPLGEAGWEAPASFHRQGCVTSEEPFLGPGSSQEP